ncbi:MAG TPA: carbohydrate ABC transporter permease [Roseiarcus sp.]|jgi:multiple sugar transport system permease protein
MKKTVGERAVLWIGIPLVTAWTFVPILAMAWASLMPFNALMNGGLLQWPSGMGLTNYKAVLGIATINQIFGGQPMAVARGFFNSAVVSILVAIIATAMATVGGYAFGRFRFPYRGTLLFVLLSVRVLPPIAVLIPYFVILSALHLVGTYFGLIVTYLTTVVPLLTWMMTGYFASLPIEIERAARIDGCGRLQALWHVTIPMASPGIAAAFAIAFLTAWNELLFGIVLTGGTAKQTLSPALLAFSPTMPSGGANLGMTLFAAGSVLSAVPPLVLALLVQRYITRLNVADPVTLQGD